MKYPPTQTEIEAVLRTHKLIRLKEKVIKAYLVGSFAKESLGIGSTRPDSDVDILLEVPLREGTTSAELEDAYRGPLRQYFVTHNIRGKNDAVHPQWQGRRVDLYFTYDASVETRPKIELEYARPADRESAVLRPRPRQ